MSLSPADAALAGRVAHALDPVFIDADARTAAALQADAPRVSNSFAVHVQLGGPGLDPDALELALVDLLREAARRHGLEV
ncbi:MAG: hypothetical protein JNL82_37520 [Myxococcales bacterium]|nr:hypothetical protein [Myxococcales bacterium]